MPILRKTEIENLEQMNGEELEQFIESLPANRLDMEEMFYFIEEKLEMESCNHSLRFAMQYMMENRLNFPKVSGWLTSNAGSCDCKVIERIATPWRRVFEQV